jgi:hypothetical protein
VLGALSTSRRGLSSTTECHHGAVISSTMSTNTYITINQYEDRFEKKRSTDVCCLPVGVRFSAGAWVNPPPDIKVNTKQDPQEEAFATYQVHRAKRDQWANDHEEEEVQTAVILARVLLHL